MVSQKKKNVKVCFHWNLEMCLTWAIFFTLENGHFPSFSARNIETVSWINIPQKPKEYTLEIIEELGAYVWNAWLQCYAGHGEDGETIVEMLGFKSYFSTLALCFGANLLTSPTLKYLINEMENTTVSGCDLRTEWQAADNACSVESITVSTTLIKVSTYCFFKGKCVVIRLLYFYLAFVP